MNVSEKGRYIFTFTAKKGSRSDPKYIGFLRTHRFYIEYYGLLEGRERWQSTKNPL